MTAAQSTTQRVSHAIVKNELVTAIGRVCLPVIVALMGFMVSYMRDQAATIQNVQDKIPVMELRLQNVETATRDAAVRGVQARAERAENQQDVMVKITALTGSIDTLKVTTGELKDALKDLSRKLDEQRAAKL